MKYEHLLHLSTTPFSIIFLLLILVFLFFYIYFAKKARNQYKKWPIYRYYCWIIGLVCITVSIIGPIAKLAHHQFVFHMITHLLLGMLAPLMLVLAAPMTLLLRTLNVYYARRLSLFLRSPFIKLVSNPLIAALLNIVGLWFIYSTSLYSATHQFGVLHIIVHIHLFLAGYFFTISMIYIEPTPHPYSFHFRSIIMILSLAGHEILSKYIYAHPPDSVSFLDGRIGGELMYYGGDVIEVMIIFILCFQWYKASQSRKYDALI